ncbi:MAG: ATP-binding cassette domain-containing protein [bacterium]|nr:ATP-binding cassette domain-containing protein [bacterium]
MNSAGSLNRVRFSERHLENRDNKGVHTWDTRLKLFLLLWVIVLNIGLAIPLLSGLLLLTGVCLLVWSAPSAGRTLFFFLAPLVPALFAFAGYSIGFGETEAASIGTVTLYKEGIISGAGVLLRVYCDISWLAVTFATSPFSGVLKALRWYKIPAILVDSLALMYRYSFLLFEEFSRMRTAAFSRGGTRGRLKMIKTMGRICAQLFMRGYDRSETIFYAMLARGSEKDNSRLHIMNESSTSLIETIENVSYAYNKIQALKNISLEIKQGETIALCGPNGSGKTTLLKICAGLLLPNNGAVKLLNKKITKKTRNNLFTNIGFLFQDSNDQLFCTTVKEDVAYGPTNMNLDPEEINERVAESLAIMKISHLENRPIHDLSSGEKKRVALAGLLAMKTPLMLLDEPTNGLDPVTAGEFIALLKELNEKYNYTLIVAMHEIDRIPEFAERVLILKDGEIFKNDDMRTVLTDIPALSSVNLEAPLITRYFYKSKKYKKNEEIKLPLSLDEALKKESQKGEK